MSLTPPHFVTDIQEIVKAALGQPYWYGAGGIDCPWPVGGPGGGANAPFGYDCSGFVLRAWQHLGLIHKKTPVGRRARDLGAFVERVEVGEQMPGDAAFYASGSEVSHVQLVVGLPDPANSMHSVCFGANGGGGSTLGNDPDACVKLSTGNYWSKFVYYGRVPAIYSEPAEVFGAAVLACAAGQTIAGHLGLPAGVVPAEIEGKFSAYAKKLYPQGVV